MAKPYAILSDQHCHNWNSFSTTTSSGINSRLEIILDELERAANELIAAGGETMVFAGDLFHVRGSIDPEVFNPTQERIKRLLRRVKIIAIPGNHDLKGRETTEIGNAIKTLGDLDGFTVIEKPCTKSSVRVLMVPWMSKVDDLRAFLQETVAAAPHDWNAGDHDLVIHAPVDGVLNIPDHGLAPQELADLGFKRVFSGHYHNHKSFCGDKVFSIGATTHQKWSDIGTKAGYLLVYDDRVVYQASHAPSFVEITDETPEDEMELIADGNYVRVRGFQFDDAEVNKFRRQLEAWGAKGVTFQIERVTANARTGTTTKPKGTTLEQSVDKFIDRMAPAHIDKVRTRCAEVLADARALAE